MEKTVVGTGGSGHRELAELLKKLGVEVLICGGIGAGAVQALAAAGIRVCAGVTRSCDAAAASYLEGTLDSVSEAVCGHSHEGHTCGHPAQDGTCHTAHTQDGENECCGHHKDVHSCGCAGKGNAG